MFAAIAFVMLSVFSPHAMGISGFGPLALWLAISLAFGILGQATFAKCATFLLEIGGLFFVLGCSSAIIYMVRNSEQAETLDLALLLFSILMACLVLPLLTFGILGWRYRAREAEISEGRTLDGSGSCSRAD